MSEINYLNTPDINPEMEEDTVTLDIPNNDNHSNLSEEAEEPLEDIFENTEEPDEEQEEPTGRCSNKSIKKKPVGGKVNVPSQVCPQVPNSTLTHLLSQVSQPFHRNCPLYILNNKLVEEPENSSKPVEIGRMVLITANKEDIDTGAITHDLTYEYLGKRKTLSISRSTLTKKNMVELQKYGVDVADCKVDKVLRFLNYQEELASHVLTHSKIGWGQWNEQLIFKHHQALGCPSTYSGKLLLAPTGNYEDWRQVIQEEAMGHTPLELALVFGLSAPVAALIAKETGIEVLFAHIYGDSTRGKTTAVRVATSTFGYPHTAKNGLIKTWNGTANAIQAHLRGNFGIPIALDEASMSNGDFTTQVYQLASGKDKDRCDKDGELRETSEWAGTVLSTAEHSLHGKSKQNTGALIRLIEIGNITWTTSADNAETLKVKLLHNYGHAGPIFVQYLMSLGTDAIMRKWRECCDTFYQAILHKDSFSRRIAEKYAILLATAELAQTALQLPLDTQAIMEMLLAVENQSSESRDIGERAYDYFLAEFQKCKLNFECENRRTDIAMSFWGRYVITNGKLAEIWVLPQTFETMMDNGQFEDTTVILQNWRDKGLLDSESGRLTRKKRLKGIDTRVHVVKVRDELTGSHP